MNTSTSTTFEVQVWASGAWHTTWGTDLTEQGALDRAQELAGYVIAARIVRTDHTVCFIPVDAVVET